MAKIYPFFNKLIFQQMDPERAHAFVIAGLGMMPNRLCTFVHADPRLQTSVSTVRFPNPLGVAAGLDKNADAVTGLGKLGFGHVEVGTVTWRAQPGNPKPRMWRVTDQHAVINALGFPSLGAEVVCARLRKIAQRKGSLIIGVNLGKNKNTPNEQASDDYVALIRALHDVADYFTINISSPNTAGLRQLQQADQLLSLLKPVIAANQQLATDKIVPVFVKIAPDLTDDAIEATADAALQAGASGIIATNTTLDRSGLPTDMQSLPGGLSGVPLGRRALEVTRILYQTIGHKAPIISVGGISNTADVIARIEAGASLVQLYTALIYQGPLLARRILQGLSQDADRRGWVRVSDLVGSKVSGSKVSGSKC